MDLTVVYFQILHFYHKITLLQNKRRKIKKDNNEEINVMKRKLAVILTAGMMIGMMAGCGNSNADTTTTDTAAEQETENSDSTAAEDSAATTEGMTGNITVVSREDGSGTRGAFIELFGVEEKNESGEKVDNTTLDAEITNNTAVMMTTVAGNPQAIGYISLGSLNDTIKAVAIDGAEATVENVENGTYKIVRPFNIVTTDELSETAQDFVDYILSAEGQVVVADSGYIPLSDAESYAGNSPEGNIVVAGSSSVSPVMEKLKEAYAEVNPNAAIEIQTSDSTTGVNSTIEGICDIGMASRELKEEETGVSATVIAQDGIAVIVNKENSLSELTSEQVKAIYTGQTTAWDEIK